MANKHRDHIERRYNLIMDALRYVIHYNCEIGCIDVILRDLRIYGENYNLVVNYEDNPVVWVLWQMIIIMYGDYGVSPRAGWITNLSGAIRFLEELKGDDKNVG